MIRGTHDKHDGDKLMWDLLPLKPIEGVVEVLTHGASKYGAESWRTVADGKNRYYAAAMRHIIAYRKGELVDKDSGLPHLAHAICNLVFLSELHQDNELAKGLARMKELTEEVRGTGAWLSQTREIIEEVYNEKTKTIGNKRMR